MMDAVYANVHNVPSRILTYGGSLNEAFTSKGHKEMVLIIPGNPGLTRYYEDFAKSLHEQLNFPVWVICHAGHELQPGSPIPHIRDFPQLYDLNGQIAHKVEFIKKYIPQDVKIHLIGHSVGSFIILNILKHELIDHNVDKNYLLFPAIERLGSSPNGKVFNMFNKYFLWLILILSSIFCLLPRVVGQFLVGSYFYLTQTKRKNVRATMHLINPIILRNIFFLAADEMDNIKDLDVETVKKFSSKLLFYYGSVDGWCPVQYYHDIKEKVPGVNALADKTGMRHAFVLNNSEQMALIFSSWIKNAK